MKNTNYMNTFSKYPITSDVELIDPRKASLYLKCNLANNRPLQNVHLHRMVQDMINDNFKHLSGSIKFTHDGKLIDGQHRLNAVILSGKAIEFLVLRGFCEESAQVIDTGKSRNLT